MRHTTRRRLPLIFSVTSGIGRRRVSGLFVMTSACFLASGLAQLPSPAEHPTTVSVDALRASLPAPSATVVEMNGMERMDLTEVSEGLYQLAIWGHGDTPCFQAILPFKWAVLAKRSRSLYVSVKNAHATPPTLTVRGNTAVVNGASGPQEWSWIEPGS